MGGIREIAQLANVSNGTVSAVLNGKGDVLRISSTTQERVWEAARALNYRPNISARRLRRTDDKSAPVIALFWTWDTRASLMGRFLKGIQSVESTRNGDIELLIQPYTSSSLEEQHSLLGGTRFNGAIVANASARDLAYLSRVEPSVPVVLYQRTLNGYSSVLVDHYRSGSEVASLFHRKGFTQVGMITPDVSSQAISLRQAGFLQTMERLGVRVAEENILTNSFSEQGGFEAASRLAANPVLPEGVFVLSDQMATGVLAALQAHHIKVPEQVQVVGYDDCESAPFTMPSLTTVHLPVERMAAASIEMLSRLIHHRSEAPLTEMFQTHIVYRNSSPEERSI